MELKFKEMSSNDNEISLKPITFSGEMYLTGSSLTKEMLSLKIAVFSTFPFDFLVCIRNKTVETIIIVHYYFSNYTLQPSRLIVRFVLDVLTFATRRLHASPRESTQ